MNIADIDRSSDNADRVRTSVVVLAAFAVWMCAWLGPIAVLIAALVGTAGAVIAHRLAHQRIRSNQRRILQVLST